MVLGQAPRQHTEELRVLSPIGRSCCAVVVNPPVFHQESTPTYADDLQRSFHCPNDFAQLNSGLRVRGVNDRARAEPVSVPF